MTPAKRPEPKPRSLGRTNISLPPPILTLQHRRHFSLPQATHSSQVLSFLARNCQICWKSAICMEICHGAQLAAPQLHDFKSAPSDGVIRQTSITLHRNLRGIASECPEESGWTAYLEDFSNHREHSSSSFDSSSLVSDAASCAAWKNVHNTMKIPKRLNFKKTRTVDDSLEDTASSPVNSPKVSDWKPPDMNSRKVDDHIITSLGKKGALRDDPELEAEEINEMNFSGKNNDCMELRKRGLCLVPLSKLVNYFG